MNKAELTKLIETCVYEISQDPHGHIDYKKRDGVVYTVGTAPGTEYEYKYSGVIEFYRGQFNDFEIKKIEAGVGTPRIETLSKDEQKKIVKLINADVKDVNESSAVDNVTASKLTNFGSTESNNDDFYVEYLRDMPHETPFMVGGKKYQFVMAKYSNGKEDIGVYAYAGDVVYAYDVWRKMCGIDKIQEIVNESNQTLRGANISDKWVEKAKTTVKALKAEKEKILTLKKSPTYNEDNDPQARLFHQKRLKDIDLEMKKIRRQYFGDIKSTNETGERPDMVDSMLAKLRLAKKKKDVEQAVYYTQALNSGGSAFAGWDKYKGSWAYDLWKEKPETKRAIQAMEQQFKSFAWMNEKSGDINKNIKDLYLTKYDKTKSGSYVKDHQAISDLQKKRTEIIKRLKSSTGSVNENGEFSQGPCAWCEKEKNIKSAASHGICERHYVEMMKQMGMSDSEIAAKIEKRRGTFSKELK